MPDIHKLSVKRVKGIGDRRSSALEQVGIHTVADLLGFLPSCYLDRSTETPIAQLPLKQEATVVGEVVASRMVPGRRPRFVATIRDESAELDCVWFGGYKYMNDAFKVGDWVSVGGKVTDYRGQRQISHPEVELLSGSEEDEDDRVHTGQIVPLHRTTANMKSSSLTARTLRRLIWDALEALDIDDSMRPDLREGLPSLGAAYRSVHFPESLDDVEAGRRRLAYDELLTVAVWGLSQRPRGSAMAVTSQDSATRLVESLPFDLTGGQQRALSEIQHDMTSEGTLHRLLQGDVGSGKTLVALMAALAVVDSGAQVAIMVPTEVLAEQHANNIQLMVEPLGIRAGLLTGRLRAADRRAAEALVASGQTQIVIGTHALLQEGTVFKQLGLVVVDEQHRFGVTQRLTLREKGEDAQLLVMTATPIPRSLALTLYGHLEVSTIDEMPLGRQPIKTGLRKGKDRDKALSFIREQVTAGRQAYIVYPRVEGSRGVRSAKAAYEELTEGPLSGLRVGLIYGSLKGQEKSTVMEGFRSGEIDVLVSTTVVEVGVDVANATVMMIEHAERFGLSQLHQLRGRVGRGEAESYCILIADPDEKLTEDAEARLNAMCETTDGFRISELDLEIRGAGQLFGTRQAGLPEFRYADLIRDQDLIEQARQVGDCIAETDPDLLGYPWLQERIEALTASGLTIAESG